MKSISPATLKKFKENYLLVLILLIGALLRLFHLDFQSPWDDEIASMIEADSSVSFRDSYDTYLAYDNMPPLYFLLLKVWSIVFGFSVYSLRLFSCIGSVYSIYAIYILAKEMFNKNTALIAATILCVNYFSIYFAQEIRPYSWLVCFACLSFWSMLRLIRDINLKNVIWYAIYTSFFLYAQFFALFAIAAQCFIFLFVFFIFSKERRLQLFKLGSIALIIILLMHLPSLRQLVKNIKITSSWIPEIAPTFFSDTLSEMFNSSELTLLFFYAFTILFLVRVSRLSFIKKTDVHTFFKSYHFSILIIIVWLLVGVLLPYLRSYLVLPILIPRYLNIVLPCLFLMMAFGLNSIRYRHVQVVLVLAFVLVNLIQLIFVKNFYSTYYKTNYRDISEQVNKNYKSDEIIVANNGWHFGLFFPNQKQKNLYQWKTLKEYSQILKQDTLHLKSFWYVSANDYSIETVIEEEAILKNKFSKTNDINALRTRAILFTVK